MMTNQTIDQDASVTLAAVARLLSHAAVCTWAQAEAEGPHSHLLLLGPRHGSVATREDREGQVAASGPRERYACSRPPAGHDANDTGPCSTKSDLFWVNWDLLLTGAERLWAKQ